MEKDNGTIYFKPEAERLRNYESIRNWLTDVMAERTGSKRTEANYLYYFHTFMAWADENVRADITPDDIINMAISKFREDATSKYAERITKKWFNWMCDKGKLARTTAKTRYGTVRSFFRYNGIRFVGKTPAATVRTRYVLPEKAKLQRMWQIATLFGKVRIGLLNDTGLRPRDAVNLEYGVIKDSFEKNEEYMYIESVSEKEDLSFAVCLTRPTTKLIHAYLEFRIREGEAIADDTPLITERHSLGQFIGTNALYRNIRDLGAKVGIKISPKYFRKRFRTSCSPIIGRDATMKMAGWKIPGAGKHYFLPPKSETVKNYRRIERIICLEDIATDLDIAAQKRMSAEMLRAAGMDPEELLTDAGIGDNVKDQADYLTRQLVGLMNIVKAVNNVEKQTGPRMSLVSLV